MSRCTWRWTCSLLYAEAAASLHITSHQSSALTYSPNLNITTVLRIVLSDDSSFTGLRNYYPSVRYTNIQLRVTVKNQGRNLFVLYSPMSSGLWHSGGGVDCRWFTSLYSIHFKRILRDRGTLTLLLYGTHKPTYSKRWGGALANKHAAIQNSGCSMFRKNTWEIGYNTTSVSIWNCWDSNSWPEIQGTPWSIKKIEIVWISMDILGPIQVLQI